MGNRFSYDIRNRLNNMGNIMKKLILILFATLGLFVVSGCTGTGGSVSSGVNLGESGEFAPVSDD